MVFRTRSEFTESAKKSDLPQQWEGLRFARAAWIKFSGEFASAGNS